MISVVVPTYRRPEVLVGCLKALHAQQLQPCEVLVCSRSTDELTASGLSELSEHDRRLVREVVVGPDDNLAVALNAGIMASRGEFVALTDDDAEAPADWTKRLIEPFEDPMVAGVGGRDIQPHVQCAARTVGKVQWFGRVIGNHHIGVGPSRDVDTLKGVNCCFRGELVRSLGIDPRLRGTGNVVHTELSLCLPIRRAGYRILYDPSIVVTHHVCPRGDGDMNHRGGFCRDAFVHSVHNRTLLVLEHLGEPQRTMFRLWQFAIGKRSEPGMAQLARLILKEKSLSSAWARYQSTREGVGAALKTWRRSRKNAQPSIEHYGSGAVESSQIRHLIDV